MGVDQQGNVVLGALLGELAWSPSLLAEEVNGLLGPGSVARGTVSDWLNRDRAPQEPLPTVVAHLISDALDREVSLAELGSGRAKPADFWVPADAGMDLPWTPAGTVEMLDDWLGHTGGAIGMDRRFFLAAGGGTLTAPAWAYVDHLASRGGSFAALVDTGRTMTVTSGTVDVIAATTTGLRALGDAEGGHADTLRLVHHHLMCVAKLLRQAKFTTAAVADRLLAEWAQRSQQAGWLAHDTGEHGLSQRYFTVGLTALGRLPTVRSRRCALVLRRLEADLAALPPTRRPAAVCSLHDRLRATHAA